MSSIPPDPLSLLTNDDLFASTLSLRLACGRSKSSLRQKHREYLCFLAEILKIESDKRGQPTPVPPYRA